MLRKHERQQHVAELKADRAKRTPEQQIQALDRRLGKGVGAAKERKRLTEPQA